MTVPVAGSDGARRLRAVPRLAPPGSLAPASPGSTSVVGLLLAERYEVGALLDTDALVQRHRGHDRRLDRPVDILLLRDDLADDPAAAALFAASMAAASVPPHPVLAAVYDLGAVAGRGRELPWAAVEPIDDPDVDHLALHDPPPTLEQWAELVLAVGARLADGLAAVHGHGLVHGNLGPHTAHLGSDADGAARVKITGVGPQPVDVLEPDDPDRTRAMWARFTDRLRYPSPEQVRHHAPTRRSDVYGLGLVLLGLLARAEDRHTATPDDAAILALAHGEEPPVGATTTATRAGVLLAGLRQVVDQATQDDPGRRQFSVTVLAGQLRDLAAGRPAFRFAAEDDATGALPPAGTAVLPAVGVAVRAPRTPVRPDLPEPLPAPGGTVPLRRPPRRRGPALALLIVVALLGWTAWTHRDDAGDPSSAVLSVPDVTGTTTDQAIAILAAAGLTAAGQREQADTQVAAGLVAGTDPPADTRLEHAVPVVLLVSAGPAQVDVPAVEGLKLDAGRASLADAGLTVAPIRYRNGTRPAGTILACDPSPGAAVAAGSAVTLTVATGKVAVPSSLTGQTVDQATAQLQDLGLAAQVRTEIRSDAAEGLVAAADPAPGAVVLLGSTVTLVVAQHPAPPEDPSTAAQTPAPTTPSPSIPPTSPAPEPTSTPTPAATATVTQD